MNAYGAGHTRKARRVVVRLTAEQREVIGHAAAQLGLSVPRFLVASALQTAESTIREHKVIKLTAQESLAFAEAILNPRMPNDKLREVFAQHDRQVLPSSDNSPE